MGNEEDIMNNTKEPDFFDSDIIKPIQFPVEHYALNQLSTIEYESCAYHDGAVRSKHKKQKTILQDYKPLCRRNLNWCKAFIKYLIHNDLKNVSNYFPNVSLFQMKKEMITEIEHKCGSNKTLCIQMKQNAEKEYMIKSLMDEINNDNESNLIMTWVKIVIVLIVIVLIIIGYFQCLRRGIVTEKDVCSFERYLKVRNLIEQNV